MQENNKSSHEKSSNITSFFFTCCIYKGIDDFFIVKENEKMFKYFGTKSEQYKNGVLVRIRHDIGGETVNSLIEKALKKMKNKEDFCLTYPSKRADGSKCWIQMDVSFDNEDAENNLYFNIIDTDVTELIETKNALREREQELLNSMKNSDEDFWVYYPSEHILSFMRDSHEHPDMPAVFNNFPEVFIANGYIHEDDKKIFLDTLTKIEAGEKKEGDIQIRLRYNESTFMWDNVHFSSIADDKDKIIKVYGCTRNINTEKNNERMYNDETNKLQMAESYIIDAFSVNISQKTIKEITKLDSSEKIKKGINSFDGLIEHVTDSIIDDIDRNRFLSMFNPEELKKQYTNGVNEFSLKYKRKFKSRIIWTIIKCILLPDENGNIIGFFYSNDINASVIYHKISEKVMNKTIDAVSYYDTVTDIYYVHSCSNPSERIMNAHPYADVLLDSVKHIAEDEKKRYMDFFSINNIIDKLSKKEVITYYYTKDETYSLIPTHPKKRIKCDIFYIDEMHETIVFLYTDVTEEYEQEILQRKKLTDALTAAENAYAAKSDFLSRMSHDIRTPINGIIGITELAQMENNSPKINDYLKKIESSSKFLLGLANDILDLSIIENSKMQLHLQAVTNKEFVESIASVVLPLCDENGIEFTIFGGDDNTVFMMDKLRVNQIFINLLSNSIKFTPRGGHIKLDMLDKHEEDGKVMIHFIVSDDGIGISEEFKSKLFKPFEQENLASPQGRNGSGLGLNITKQLVELMDGKISVESTAGKGSTFHVYLPFDIKQEQMPVLDHITSDISVLKGKKVLVCEDNDINREILCEMLGKELHSS